MAEPQLHMIATPLGHRDDLTLRAKEMLGKLRVFFAEDTRELRKLLDLHGIGAAGKVILSYSSHNMKDATEKALRHLREGENIGFVCDRGTPAISDPGAILVRAVREAGFQAIPIPGPSSVTALFSVAGMDSGKFVFLGFLPATAKERKEMLEKIRAANWPACIFESPKRIRETAGELKAFFPEGRILIGREMTKLFETYQWLDLNGLDPESLIEKGEYAVIIDPGPPVRIEADWLREVEARLAHDKEWAKFVAEKHGVGATEVYNALQQRKRDRS